MRPPQTRSSLSLPRGTNRLTRLVPARNALRMAAPRLSPPRRKIRAGRRAPAARPRPSHAPQPCRATLPLGFGKNNLARLRAEPVLRRAQNVFLRRSGQLPHLVQRRSDRPTGKKNAGILSASRRGGRRPKAMSSAENALRPAPKLRSVGTSAEPRAHLPSALARKTHGASAESSTSPSEGSRTHGPATPSRRAVTGTQRLPRRASSKNIPAFKLENPSAAEAGDGNESTKEIPYLPSFLRRVRTVSDSSAPLPTQA